MKGNSSREKFQELLRQQREQQQMQTSKERKSIGEQKQERETEKILNGEEDGKRKPRWGVRIGIGAACLMFAGGMGYYGYRAYSYRDRFFEGTTINEIDCGGLTVAQAEDKIRKKVENYRMTVEFRNGVSEEISGGEIDYQYVSDGSVEALCQKQNPLLWIRAYFEKEEYQIEENVKFDQQKLEERLDQMPELMEENQQQPTDAYVEFSNGEFVIVPETEGTVIQKDALLAEVEEAVGKSSSRVLAEEADAYVQPAVRQDDDSVIRERDQLNSLVKVSVTYELPGGEQKVLDGNELKNWLVKDEQGNYSRDEEKFEEKLEEYVKDLADQVNTKGKDRKFHTTSGLDVTVNSDGYGWKINQKEERKALRALLKAQESVSREPEYSSREMGEENNGLGENYIEVNLTEQHLYYYRNGEMVLDSPLVSGKMTSDRFTPPGIFLLTYKQKDRILKGRPLPNGQPSYESHVDFWMPFNGGIGLHDASWRGTFGGTIYRYSGSHGCINLPRSKAAQIYEMIDKETPIVCVYNDGYSLIG